MSKADPIPSPSQDGTSENLPTLPATHIQDGISRAKTKRPPAVTPRSFTRFFTPRSSQESPRVSTSRDALRNITKSVVNRGDHAPELVSGTATFDDLLPLDGVTENDNRAGRPKKRRRLSVSVTVHNDQCQSSEGQIHSQPTRTTGTSPSQLAITAFPSLPIRPSSLLRLTGSLLCRSFGGTSFVREMSGYDSVQAWREQASNFYSRHEDLHTCDSLPFCATSCYTNPLVAVGDEEGGVRLLETAKAEPPGFSKAWLVFKPHANAILDLKFSSDDKLLATASGDQTAVIIDMPTQTTICTLSRHASSVKQIRFQPQSGDTVVVTSSRDGNVNVWDLRCSTKDRPALEATTALDPAIAIPDQPGTPRVRMHWASITDQIRGGHTGSASKPKGRNNTKPISSASGSSKPDSVTSLEFLRPHIFATASESNACVKLWDMRISYSHRRGQAVPVSNTREPESHQNHRQFGITSMTFSGDKGRLYTVCRDNTIYAYSTSHLILGHAPELLQTNSRPRRYGDMDKEGLGPLYGFRHPRFHVATFYIKSSLRTAADDNTELLAVGSSDNCAIVFPTDERLLPSTVPPFQNQKPRSSDDPARPSLSRSSSGLKLSTRLTDTIPIYANSGTCLTAGHQKEVGGLTWAHGGALVTASDDFGARCWREGRDAKLLRKGGESGGARWGCGWAETDDDSESDED